jgi:beta-mannosidase
VIVLLNGIWKFKLDPDEVGKSLGYYFKEFEDKSWDTIKVPSQWEIEGYKYYTGTAWYRTKYIIDHEMTGKNLSINFNGVDYFSDIWADGIFLGSHEGYFNPFEYEIENIAGRHILAVRVNAPAPRMDWKNKNIAKGSLYCFDCKGDPYLYTAGIWQDVFLEANEKYSIKTVCVDAKPDKDRQGVVHIRLGIKSNETIEHNVSVLFYIKPKNFQSVEKCEFKENLSLKHGLNNFEFIYKIKNPMLWWTWDLGYPNLYILETKLQLFNGEDDIKVSNFGIREFTGGPDQDWAMYLNGERFFLRGTVYMSNLYQSLMDGSTYRKDIELMINANMNGALILAIVEKDEFYSLCDEMGLLLFQVFPLVWGDWDFSGEFTERCKPMMMDMINILYNHPSIGIWACASEPDLNGFEYIAKPIYEQEMGPIPFSKQNPPVILEVIGKKISQWHLENNNTSPLPLSPVVSNEKEEIIHLRNC